MAFPKHKDKVIAFNRAHPSATVKETAAALGLAESYIRSTAHRYGFKFQNGRGEFVYVPRDVADRLDATAADRGLTFQELASKLLSVIATDGLVGAVLDEG